MTNDITSVEGQITRVAKGTSARTVSRACVFPLSLAVLIGILFGLPHLLIPLILGQDNVYTPFAINGVSALTYDESYIYAAQANYTSTRWRPPFDTDAFEYRDIPTVMPTVPYFGLAGLAWLVGGTERAFIVCDFVLPAVAFLLFYYYFLTVNALPLWAALSALVTLSVPFGPRNFVSPVVEIFRTGRTSAIQPLEYSRLLHPELSFTLLLAALFFLLRTWRDRRIADAVMAGLFGGLVFYCYVYYWLPWVTACAVLLVVFICQEKRLGKHLVIVNALTWLIGAFYWVVNLQARRFPNYAWRLSRFGLEHGHIPPKSKVLYTAIYILIGGVFFMILRLVALRRAEKDSPRQRYMQALWFHICVFVAGLIALNAEVLTGLNVESMEHYPNRFFQPYLCMLLCLAVGAVVLTWAKQNPGIVRTSRMVAMSILAVMFACGAMRQVAVAKNTAVMHEYKDQERLLFSWLGRNTQVDDVVVTSDLVVNYLLPVFTRDRVFVPNGTRTTASNDEIERRFLTAMKLLGHTDEDVTSLLVQDSSHGYPPLGHTYTYYLFQNGNGSIDRRLPAEHIRRALDQFRALDLSQELSRFRVNYVYVKSEERLQNVKGWRLSEVYRNDFGILCRVQQYSEAASTRAASPESGWSSPDFAMVGVQNTAKQKSQ